MSKSDHITYVFAIIVWAGVIALALGKMNELGWQFPAQ